MDFLKAFGIEVGKGKHYEEIVYGTALLYNLIEAKVSTHLSAFNLTTAKFNVLMILQHQAGHEGMSQVDISKHLIVTASNVTRLLDKLEKEGLVQRSALKNDRRVKTIKITPKGSQLLDRAWPGYTDVLKVLSCSLNLNDQKTLADLLTKSVSELVKN